MKVSTCSTRVNGVNLVCALGVRTEEERAERV